MFHLAHPVISLQPFIEKVWYCNRYIPETAYTKTLPFGRIEMIVRLSGTYSILYKKEEIRDEDIWITGQLTKPTITAISGQHECIGIVFTALGYNAFSRIPAHQLQNSSIHATELFRREISSLPHELAEIKTVREKFEKLNDFLLKEVILSNKLSMISEALDFIRVNECEKKVTVSALCKHLKISRKSLNQHFQKYIGLPASVYLQQKLFNKVIKELSEFPEKKLVGTGYNYEFFDQAHFIKQFYSFAGITPRQYQQLVKNNAVVKLFPNFLDTPQVTLLQ